MGPSDAQVVVGTLAVVVHLHEVGLGLLVDFRPTDPSLANLAVDRQALLLDEEAPNQFLTGPPLLEWEGVVVMVIHSLPLRSPPPLLGNGRDDGHGHTQSSLADDFPEDHPDRDQDHQDQDQDETTKQLRERTTARGHESFGGLPQAPPWPLHLPFPR